MDDIEKLKKTVKEQNTQIESMKKAISVLQQQLIAVSKKLNRTYESGRRNTNDINTVSRTLQTLTRRNS